MDLTESIRAKIDDIRRTKTARYTATCAAVQDRISKLNSLSTNLYAKLEDVLEQDTTSPKPKTSVPLTHIPELDQEDEDNTYPPETSNDKTPVKQTNLESFATDISPEPDTQSLQHDAFATSELLDEKRKKLIAIRERHADAMARLDRLENDLTRISKEYEDEEQSRLTSTPAISKKRKREEDSTSPKLDRMVQISVGFVAGAAMVGAVTSSHLW